MTEKITKDDIAAALAVKTGQTKASAREAVDTILAEIQDGLATGKEINLAGFAKLTVQAQPEREGRNPRTGEKTTIAAKNKVKFAAAKALNDAVNG